MDAWNVLKEEDRRRKYDREFTMQLQVRTQQISCNRKLGAPHDYHIYIIYIHTHIHNRYRAIGSWELLTIIIYIYRYMSTHMKVQLNKKRTAERFQKNKDANEAHEKERQQKKPSS